MGSWHGLGKVLARFDEVGDYPFYDLPYVRYGFLARFALGRVAPPHQSRAIYVPCAAIRLHLDMEGVGDHLAGLTHEIAERSETEDSPVSGLFS